jgi:Stigma-specific protein, Stig1
MFPRWPRRAPPSTARSGLGTADRHILRDDDGFDDLARAFGSCTTRRGTLKLILTAVAGATVGPELLAACDDDEPRPHKSDCPPLERERCCTSSQLHACEKTASLACAKAAHRCAKACANQQSAACQACKKSAARLALRTYSKCTASTCLKLVPTPSLAPHPTPAVSTASAVSSGAGAKTLSSASFAASLVHGTEQVTIPADNGNYGYCNYTKLQDCRNDKAKDFDKCWLLKCAALCIFGAEVNPACDACTLTCMSEYALALFTDCVHNWGCGGIALCSPENICCLSAQTVCNGQCCEVKQVCCPGGYCASLLNNPSNCGSCGNVCPAGEKCETFHCVSCPQGETVCDNNCVDTQTDIYNCGGCGNACTGGKTCCTGQCADLTSDSNNCGSCGTACTASQFCQRGTCTEGCGGTSCDFPNTCCSNTCVNTSTDPANCGTCGHACQAGETCQDGQCNNDCNGQCASWEICCPCASGGGNCCYDPADQNNCGSCGNMCSASQICCGGTCIPCIYAPYATCCEGGYCCDAYGGIGQVCCNGQCCWGSCCGGQCCNNINGCCGEQCCPGNTQCCGTSTNPTCCPTDKPTCCRDPATGDYVCVDTNSDANNCGFCGNVCGGGTTCISGRCTT